MVSTTDELSLIKRAASSHDRKAFGCLVVKYQSAIRRFFLHQTLGDTQLSDDLAQDTFVKAFLNIDKFRGASAFSTWLYRIAYNVLYDYMRRQHPTSSIDDAPLVRMSTGNVDANLRLDVYDALARLGDTERTCVTLQLIDGYPIEQIAEIMGMPAGTVKSHLFRGKEKLTMFLKKNGYDGKR